MKPSPFLTHREILVNGDYSAAGFLRDFTMAMFAGEASPANCSGIRNLDPNHMRIFFELASSYNANGENDADFMEVCQAIRRERRDYAARIKKTLDDVLATDPDSYEGGRDEHRSSVRFYSAEHEKNVARGWFWP